MLQPLKELKQLEPFSSLDQELLNTVARHARIIELPPGRRIQSPGRVLNGRYYLLQGRLKILQSGRLVRPSRQPLRLTSGGVITLSAARLLHVDIGPVSFLFTETDANSLPVACTLSDPDGWQQRFLRSHMLAPLPVLCWQQILRALSPRQYLTGETVLVEGETGSECFILAAGRATVGRGGATLCNLLPGDFFGEDALLAGAPRNATVTMASTGTVMALGQQHFQRWLADVLISANPDSAAARTPGQLTQDQRTRDRELHHNQQIRHVEVAELENLRDRLSALDACCRYRLSGPRRVATLAVFLLRQRGIRAELAADL